MSSFVLVLYIFAGAMSSGDSVALTNIPGFATKAACEAEGKQAERLVKGSFKDLRFVCVQTTTVR